MSSSNINQIKATFENDKTIYTIDFPKPTDNNKETIDKALQMFLKNCTYGAVEQRSIYHLYNPNTQLYVLTLNDVQAIANKNITCILKNCSIDAEQTLQELVAIDNSFSGIPETMVKSGIKSNSNNNQFDILGFLFRFKNKLSVSVFNEEFIEYEGIKYLLPIIEQITGNKRAYAIDALSLIFDYQSSIEYITEHKEIIGSIYNILMETDSTQLNVNGIKHALQILITLQSHSPSFSDEIIISAENYARNTNTQPYYQLVGFLESTEVQLINDCFLLLCILLKTRNNIDKPNLLVKFQEVGFVEKLSTAIMKEAIDEKRIAIFEEEYRIIMKNPNLYNIEICESKIRRYEEKLREAQEEMENIFFRKRYFEDIIDDLVFYKKLAQTSFENGAMYTSKDINFEHMDENLKIKVKPDSNGFINLRRIIRESQKKESDEIKQKVEVLKGIKEKYDNMKEQMTKTSISNKELTEEIYKRKDELAVLSVEGLVKEREKEIEKLNEELNGIKKVVDELQNQWIDEEHTRKDIRDEVYKLKEVLGVQKKRFEYVKKKFKKELEREKRKILQEESEEIEKLEKM